MFSGSAAGARTMSAAVLPIYLLAAIPVAAADLREHRIPNALVIFGLTLAVWWAGGRGDAALVESLLGGALGLALFGCVWLLFRGRMGLGDVKFAAVVGAFCGVAGLFAATLVAAVLGLLVALALIVKDRRNARNRIPFGPFLSAGGTAALVARLAGWPGFLFGGSA
jgi:prepilin signal peptidase PulO-like enzyme (type II secretory pathway)